MRLSRREEHYMHTCCVFELHSIYEGAPISFFISSPFKQKRKIENQGHRPTEQILAFENQGIYLSTGDGNSTSMVHKELFIITKICT